jgi:putative nucleotidyltransferase with HDIG domain
MDYQPPQPSVRGNEILIIDADQLRAARLQKCLQHSSTPHVAHNSKEAVEFVQRNPVNILLFAGSVSDMTEIDFLRFGLTYAPNADRILMANPEKIAILSSNLKKNIKYYLLPNDCTDWEVQQFVDCVCDNQRLSEDNANLGLQFQDLLKTTLSAMTDILEAKDPYTSGHSYRVSQYALAIARQMKLPKKDIHDLEIGGLLHDIGKIGIPESVLHKSGKLTDEEYRVIKNHPSRGYMMLWRLPGMMRSLDVVRYHHERYDGQGYPEGIKGKKTPLLARILSVADSYDAMTSSRPYRPAMTHADAVLEVEKNSGSQFDPDVANVFLKLREMGEIRQVIEGAIDLPAFSPVIRQAMLVINSPKWNIRQLADLLSSDQAITAKVMRLANSVAYGLPQKISGIDQALAYIGMDELFRIIVLISAQPALNQEKGLALWTHTIETAYCAEILSRREPNIDDHEAFLAGLFHDMGKSLLLHYFPKAYERAMEMTKAGTPVQIAEVMVFGIDHAEIGAWLMEHWEMPTDLCNAVRYHHAGDMSNKPLIHVVTLANSLAHILYNGTPNILFSSDLFDRFHLTPDDFPAIQNEVDARTKILKSLILEI